MKLQPFFVYCRERYQILLNRRAGLPKPWTKDPILQRYSFCNTFREDDKTTVWFRENFRGMDKVTVFSCAAFRLFNRIETGKVLVEHNLLAEWNARLAHRVLKNLKPIFTGAYIVHSPAGMNKLNGVIEILRPVWKAQREGMFDDMRGGTLEWAHQKLKVFPCIGNFLAYQICADLRFTPILSQAPDILTWACAGPGTARGLARVLRKPIDFFHYGNDKGQELMLPYLRELLVASQDWNDWPSEFPRLEMQDVTNCLCEWDKYERTRLGEGRPKSLYPG